MVGAGRTIGRVQQDGLVGLRDMLVSRFSSQGGRPSTYARRRWVVMRNMKYASMPKRC